MSRRPAGGQSGAERDLAEVPVGEAVLVVTQLPGQGPLAQPSPTFSGALEDGGGIVKQARIGAGVATFGRPDSSGRRIRAAARRPCLWASAAPIAGVCGARTTA